MIKALGKIRGRVVKARIGPTNGNGTHTMSSILQARDISEIEILKIDIEGAELDTMERFLDKYTISQVIKRQMDQILSLTIHTGWGIIMEAMNGVFIFPHVQCFSIFFSMFAFMLFFGYTLLI